MESSPDLLIRARRATFNRAIADGDAQAIGPILARDCVMVTGTDSAVIAGRNAQVKVWQREFAAGKSGSTGETVIAVGMRV
jgi:ketosteroid isomerase-like protein